MVEEYYVFQSSNGCYIGIDRSTGPMSTGGYPIYHEKLRNAELFWSKEAALKYEKHWKSENWKLWLVKINRFMECEK